MRLAVTTGHDPSKDILEVSRLHRLMVFFQKAERLPPAGILLLQALAALLAGGVWYGFNAAPQSAPAVSLTLWLASLGDVAILRRLRRRQISFGPWKSQTVVLLIPRTVVGLILGLPVPVLGTVPMLAVFVMAQLAGSLMLWWGAAVEPRRLALTHLDLRVDNLPPGAAPLRLLHISDIHLERFAEREERLLSLVHEAAPDVILITGDYLNLSYNEDAVAQQQVAHLLSQLHAPHGIYATLGSPPVDLRPEIVPLLASLPIRVLRDEWTKVDMGGGASLVLMGLDCTHHLHQDGAQLARVAAEAPNSAPRVLLYHSPELMPEANRHGVDLYLCGHTHGGQYACRSSARS